MCFLNRSPFKPTPKEHIPPPQATFRPPFDFNFPRGCGWSDPRSDPRAAERQLAAWQSLPCPASETEPREPQVRPLCTIQQWHHPPWYGFWKDGWTLLVSGNPMIQQWHHPPLGSKAFSAIGFGGMDGYMPRIQASKPGHTPCQVVYNLHTSKKKTDLKLLLIVGLLDLCM